MRVDLLRRAIEDDVAAGVVPIAVVATAGTTNTGAIDPIRAPGEVAHEFGAWFHVDGAYGMLGLLDDRVAPLYDGIDLADSAIVDPHKWLGAPVGIAATFVRDRSILGRAFTQEPAAYLEGAFDATGDVRMSLDSIGIPYSEFAVELSAPSRGAVVWSIIRELGRDGVRAQNPPRQRLRATCRRGRPKAPEARAHHRARPLDLLLPLCGGRHRRPQRLQHRPAASTRARDAVPAQLDNRQWNRSSSVPASSTPAPAIEHVDGFVDAVVAIGDEMLEGAAG